MNPDKKRKNSHDEIEVDLSLPEPPSKKARRALKKGKALPASVATNKKDIAKNFVASISEPTHDDSEEKPTKKERSEYSIWIGNLAFFTTRESLASFLIDHSGGSITREGITRIKMPMSKEKPNSAAREQQRLNKNKGFAYVDFGSESAMYAAIALSESALDGRNLLIKSAVDFGGRPLVAPNADADPYNNFFDGNNDVSSKSVSASEQQQDKRPRKIFVGNLPYTATEEILRAHFSPCGEISVVKVATFEDTPGKCKGYAWVTFGIGEGASNAKRGFVRIPVAQEDEEWDLGDFMGEQTDNECEDIREIDDDSGRQDENERKEENGDDARVQEKKRGKIHQKKKVKLRKWWVNRFQGRELKIEFAEDDTTRYHKRFGRNRQGTSALSQEGEGKARKQQQQKGGKAISETLQELQGDNNTNKEQQKSPPTAYQAQQKEGNVNVSYRTGGIVESRGTKVTFE